MSPSSRWTCPACGRTFGRSAQGHLCVPVQQLDDFLAAQPHRNIFEAVVAHVQTLEDAIIEPGDAYLMFKRRRKFAALAPRQKWARLWFIVPRIITHDRIQSHDRASGRAAAHYVQIHSADQVDDTLKDWLTEAYEAGR